MSNIPDADDDIELDESLLMSSNTLPRLGAQSVLFGKQYKINKIVWKQIN